MIYKFSIGLQRKTWVHIMSTGDIYSQINWFYTCMKHFNQYNTASWSFPSETNGKMTYEVLSCQQEELYQDIPKLNRGCIELAFTHCDRKPTNMEAGLLWITDGFTIKFIPDSKVIIWWILCWRYYYYFHHSNCMNA